MSEHERERRQPIRGLGEGLKGIQRTSRLNRPVPAMSQDDIRDIAEYVASDQAVADSAAVMDRGHQMINEGINAALTTHRRRSPGEVAQEAAWTKEVIFKKQLEQQLEHQQHYGSEDPTDDLADVDEAFDRALSFQPQAASPEDEGYDEAEWDDEDDEPEAEAPYDPLADIDLAAPPDAADAETVYLEQNAALAEQFQNQQARQQSEHAQAEAQQDAGEAPEEMFTPEDFGPPSS